MDEEMTLEDLMRISYNAGGYTYDETPKAGGGFAWWWEKFGKDRHDAFIDAVYPRPAGPPNAVVAPDRYDK